MSDRPKSSPSRSRANGHKLNQSQSLLHIDELSRLLVDEDRGFKKKLDEEALAQQHRHVQALEQALAQHEAIRRSAEHVYETVQLENERQLLARAAAQRRKVEEERRKLVEAQEAELKRLEEERKEEEQRRHLQVQLEQQKKASAERAAAQKHEEELAKTREAAAREKQIADKKVAEQEKARHERQQQQQQSAQQTAQVAVAPVRQPVPPAPNSTATPALSGTVTRQDDRIRTHNAYLQIHARCKELRKEIQGFREYKHADDNIKHRTDAVRRTIGQLVKNNPKANQDKIKTVIEQWKWSISCLPNETVDINAYRVQPVQPFPVPKVFLYMVNYTCKVIVRQMSVDCIDAGFAEPLGVCTATMFAQPDFKPQGHSMADMFLAKFHRSLPPLFGIFHDELTVEGRNKLGFRTDAHGSRENWVSNAKGLARGYAAVTLRDFSRSKNQNPFPNRLYWESIARISTTPQPQQLMLHFAILDGLLDPHFIPRFIRCYGGYALAALRLAIIDFPTTRDRRKKSHEEQAKQLGNMLAKYEDVLQLRL